MSESLTFEQIAHSIMFLSKNERFAQKTDEQIPNPAEIEPVPVHTVHCTEIILWNQKCFLLFLLFFSPFYVYTYTMNLWELFIIVLQYSLILQLTYYIGVPQIFSNL